MSHKIVIIDDHFLFTKALEDMVNNFEGYEVLFCAENGKDFIEKLSKQKIKPEVVLLDLNMPIMNGFEALSWIKSHRPELKVLILSMNDEENNIIHAVRNGANGYLLKNTTPKDLKFALDHLLSNGFYHNELVSSALLNSVNAKPQKPHEALKDQEIRFLKLVCTEMTYKEIAEEMCLSPKTIDGYRQALFDKLNIKSRVGLVLFAMNQKIID
ncbi:MAG TPA: response regulator transcription factor [Moheibacter sp.]|nr:response regulator transcription factor [Moheibacter sp.]